VRTVSGSPPVLCLGEAVVDLVGQPAGLAMGQIRQWEPHLGGTVANVAVVAARLGTPVMLAGAVGDDDWGRWARDRLVQENVGVGALRLASEVATQLAFVAVDHDGEPTYRLLSEPVEPIVTALEADLDELVQGAAALFISSNTLARTRERALTMRARERAIELGRPVVFDCNLRLHRWSSRADAAASANACVSGALLLRANLQEAELMTGESDPERAAMALRKAGARLVAITLGDGGAILRGAEHADVRAVPADVVCTMGAGDAFTGTILARLAASGFYPAAAAAAMTEAAQAAARACARWGSVD
jgi:sugar/nucleoside kinase (ribokinase family)